MQSPQLSVVMLVIDLLRQTQRAIESLRATTDVPYELIVVDNGSRDPAVVSLLEREATTLLRNSTNVGVPAGWNQGLAAARAPLVAIANNDITFVPGWFAHLAESLTDPTVGLVCPASDGGGDVQRPQPGAGPLRLAPFGPTPHGLLMLLRTQVLRDVGGFCELYTPASNEDKDLCFTLWDRGLAVVVDHRVVVPHEAGSTWLRTLGRWRARRLWKRNRALFKRRWRHRLGD
ncbi:MAG: glycosyltransferase family 2 protein [Planctomycetota bacterium]